MPNFPRRHIVAADPDTSGKPVFPAGGDRVDNSQAPPCRYLAPTSPDLTSLTGAVPARALGMLLPTTESSFPPARAWWLFRVSPKRIRARDGGSCCRVLALWHRKASESAHVRCPCHGPGGVWPPAILRMPAPPRMQVSRRHPGPRLLGLGHRGRRTSQRSPFPR